MLGEDIDPGLLSDTNVGRSLDAIARCGTGRILSARGVQAVRCFHLDPVTISYDTTSASVWGSCELFGEETDGPHLTEGHSKDHRPDLKQFMTELLCVDMGIPIFGQILDGNASDKESNHRILKSIASLMKEHGLGEGAFIYIADSAMVTTKNLAAPGHTRFISRLPATFSVCDTSIHEAVDRAQWIEIGSLNEVPDSRRRPAASCQAAESTVTIGTGLLSSIPMHWTSMTSSCVLSPEKTKAPPERRRRVFLYS